jgi:hypothetical protein
MWNWWCTKEQPGLNGLMINTVDNFRVNWTWIWSLPNYLAVFTVILLLLILKLYRLLLVFYTGCLFCHFPERLHGIESLHVSRHSMEVSMLRDTIKSAPVLLSWSVSLYLANVLTKRYRLAAVFNFFFFFINAQHWHMKNSAVKYQKSFLKIYRRTVSGFWKLWFPICS